MWVIPSKEAILSSTRPSLQRYNSNPNQNKSNNQSPRARIHHLKELLKGKNLKKEKKRNE
jgi:hypothetical protein